MKLAKTFRYHSSKVIHDRFPFKYSQFRLFQRSTNYHLVKKGFFFLKIWKTEQGLRDNSRLVTCTACSGASLKGTNPQSWPGPGLSNHVTWLHPGSTACSPFPPLLTVSLTNRCCAWVHSYAMDFSYPSFPLFKINLSVCYAIWVLKGNLQSNLVNTLIWLSQNHQGFPGGPVVKSLPCNARDTGLIPDPRRSHMPWNK